MSAMKTSWVRRWIVIVLLLLGGNSVLIYGETAFQGVGRLILRPTPGAVLYDMGASTTAWYLEDTPPFVQSAILLGRYTVHKSPVDILHPRYRLELIFFYSVPRGIVRSYVVTRTTLLHNAIHYGFHSIITPITIDPVDFLARTILENIFKHHNSGPPVPRYHPDFLAPV